MLELDFLADRGVAFPVMDLEQDLVAERAWNGWIENATSVIAVSVVRGVDPSDRDAAITDDATGVVVWSFDPNRLEGDSKWPARQASLFLGLQFAHSRDVPVRDGMNEMHDILDRAGQPVDVEIDGQMTTGTSWQFPPVGSVISAVSPVYAVAAAYFRASPITSFSLITTKAWVWHASTRSADA